MTSQLRPALVCLLILTAVCGVLYPACVTAVAVVAFPRQAAGSLIEQGGKAVGSALIGQPFTDPKYFWTRPSATAPQPYNAGAGAGSNLAPSNPALVDAVKQRVGALRAADPGNASPVPVDLVTCSGSGLDPQISVAAARYQLNRVARARGLDPGAVERLVEQHTQARFLGLVGEPVVAVVPLNLALDRQAGGAIDAAARR
jgi:K+-transporting ATPase ATPase C chain